MPKGEYIGSELEIFKHAVNWKRYYASIISPYLGGEVLEVGAGIGATTKVLVTERQSRWVCLEPDSTLVEEIVEKISDGRLPPICEPRVGDISHLEEGELFDSVIYIDVLEHIEDDRVEIARAAKHLKKGGHLVVLAPAHQFLYTPFDEAIGHFRRYSRSDILSVVESSGLLASRSIYLDSVGTLASFANRLLLRSRMPTGRQIIFWDRFLVPASRLLDAATFYKFGKSVLGIWRRV